MNITLRKVNVKARNVQSNITLIITLVRNAPKIAKDVISQTKLIK